MNRRSAIKCLLGLPLVAMGQEQQERQRPLYRYKGTMWLTCRDVEDGARYWCAAWHGGRPLMHTEFDIDGQHHGPPTMPLFPEGYVKKQPRQDLFERHGGS